MPHSNCKYHCLKKTARIFNVKYPTVFGLIDMVDTENATNKHDLMKASTRFFFMHARISSIQVDEVRILMTPVALFVRECFIG